MKFVAAVLLGLTMSVLSVLPASAGDNNPGVSVLFTAPLPNLPPGWLEPIQYTCDIVNLSTAIRNVTISLLDASGIALTDAVGSFALNPGQATGLRIHDPDSSYLRGLHYCKFEVQGSKDDFRAAMSFWLNPQGLVSVPAH
jgi:hypothetical protein